MAMLPTDRELLKAIYDRYYDDYIAFDTGAPRGSQARSSMNHVPIDIDAIARDIGSHPELVFGRLYFHLEREYGHRDDDGTRSPFFSMRVGGDHHAINFPYLTAVLAELEDKDRRWKLATGMALISLIISLVTFGLSMAARFG